MLNFFKKLFKEESNGVKNDFKASERACSQCIHYNEWIQVCEKGIAPEKSHYTKKGLEEFCDNFKPAV